MSELSSMLLAATLLVQVLAAPLGAGVNEWTMTGPVGGSAMAFALAPSAPQTLYAWDRNRLWRSDDRGESWRLVPSELLDFGIMVLVVDPTDPERLYANSENRLSFSTDGGATWRPFAFGGTIVNSLVVDPDDPDRLWAASVYIRDDGVSVWRSDDGGRSWGAASRGLPRTGEGIDKLVLDPGGSGTLWAVGLGVWRSDDGRSWQRRTVGLPDAFFRSIAVDPADSDTLYACGDAFGLWKTVDGGTTWQTMPTPRDKIWQCSDVAVDPEDSETLYFLTPHEVVVSKDGGVTWTVATEVHSWGHELTFDPSRPEIVYANFRGGPEDSSNGGLLRSDDGGEHWRTVGVPVPAGVGAAPDLPGTIYATNIDGLFRSTDGGESWAGPLHQGLVTSVAFDPEDPNVLYASAPPQEGGFPTISVYRSTDGGDTWDALDLGFDWGIYRVETDPVRPGVVYGLTGGGPLRLFKTQDGGDNWVELPSGRAERLLVDPADPDVLYGVVHGAGVSRSDDGGLTWSDASNGLPSEGRLSLAIAGTALYAATGGGTFRSDDGGASWQLVAAELAGEVCDLLADPSAPGVLYAGTFEEGVWRSDDEGRSWLALGIGPGDGRVCELAIDPARPETVYAGTDAGVQVLTREPCVPDETTLCVDDRPGDRRFRVRMSFATEEGGGRAGDAVVTSLAPLGLDDGGVMAFFSPTNPEVLVKVLDGCAFNGHFWVFAAAATSVGTELVVEDTLGAKTKTWVNPDGAPAPTLTDNGAFASCGERPPRARRTKGTAAPPVGAVDVGGGCLPDATTLCLGDGRFRVRMAYDTVQGGGRSGDAAAIPLSPLGLDDGGVMAFFSATNPEVLVKVLDGCALNGRYWVFAAAATNVGFELVVDDLVAGTTRVYRNPDVHPAGTITDVDAFATCSF